MKSPPLRIRLMLSCLVPLVILAIAFGAASWVHHFVLMMVIFIILATFPIVIWISLERQFFRPVSQLKKAIMRMGNGDYNHSLPVIHRNDESAELFDAFNEMISRIREQNKMLQLEGYGRMRSFIDGEEMERQRLSRELHDGIGQSLIAVKFRLENLLYQNGAEVQSSVQELKRHFDGIIDEVRRMSNNLMPSVLEAFGLVIAFRNLFSETEEHSGLRIHFEARGDFGMMDKRVMTYVYRLTQEAINNIIKHAEASHVNVTLNRDREFLNLDIEDNGKGFSPEARQWSGGNGILNMHERASLLSGQLHIQSKPGKGTHITLTVPIIIHYVEDQDFPRG